MTTRREFVIAVGAGLWVLVPFASFAQQNPAKIARIGILNSEAASDPSERSRLEGLRQGLREHGYEEGRNLAIELRWAEGKYEQLPGMAAELARLNVDVIVPFGIKALVAAKGATTTIPIVIPATSSDPVALGLVSSLAKPGGNITGATNFGPEIMAKRLELLKDAMPRITRVAVLGNPANASFEPTFQQMNTTARSLKLSLQPFEMRAPGELNGVLAAIAKARVDAIVIQDDTLFTANAKTIADLPPGRRLPSIGNRAFAEAGGLIGYGVNIVEMYRRSAATVDKILIGAKPRDLPLEQATRFDMVLNQKTAKALGVTFPNAVLARANRVIE